MTTADREQRKADRKRKKLERDQREAANAQKRSDAAANWHITRGRSPRNKNAKAARAEDTRRRESRGDGFNRRPRR